MSSSTLGDDLATLVAHEHVLGETTNRLLLAAAEPPEEEEAPKVEVAAKDIAAVLFSTQGNFLQELLIDEGVAAIDALSRAALVQLIRGLGPLSFPITAPLILVFGGGAQSGEGILTRDDKEALLLLRRIAQYVQASGQGEGL